MNVIVIYVLSLFFIVLGLAILYRIFDKEEDDKDAEETF